MKTKRILSLLLTLVMVIGMLPTFTMPANAALDTTKTGGCNGDHTGYTAITKNSNGVVKITSAGNYYLTGDITVSSSSYKSEVNTSGTVTICLNGHKFERTNISRTSLLINGGATVNICDCSADQTGTISGGSDALTIDGTVNMYGGTITGATSTYGVGVRIYSTGTFNMYGGTITQNTRGLGFSSSGGIANIYGASKIYGNTKEDVYGSNGSNKGTVNIGNLTEGANIYFTTISTAKVTADNPQSVLQYLHSTDTSKSVIVDANGNLSLHSHSYSAATCTAPATCSCGATTGGLADHSYVSGVLHHLRIE